MRTTLSLDDDILSAARAIAKRERKTIGQVVSELARDTLRKDADAAIAAKQPID